MDDQRVGAAFRAIRIRRGWRQRDVAERAGVSRAFISAVERGLLDRVSLSILRRVAAVLDIHLDVVPRWRGGELDRLLNSGHAALHESVVSFLGSMPGWEVVPEASFSIYGERGVIDLLAWHAPSRSLLVIELKTAIVEVNDLVGGVDRKRRLARRIAVERGWQAATVSCWVIVARGKTSQRRVEAHRSMLRAAFPASGREARHWLRRPQGSLSALSMWSDATPRDGRPLGGQRVRVRTGQGRTA